MERQGEPMKPGLGSGATGAVSAGSCSSSCSSSMDGATGKTSSRRGRSLGSVGMGSIESPLVSSTLMPPAQAPAMNTNRIKRERDR